MEICIQNNPNIYKRTNNCSGTITGFKTGKYNRIEYGSDIVQCSNPAAKTPVNFKGLFFKDKKKIQKNRFEREAHIDFTPAKTLKEAKNFGTKTLGIEVYSNFKEEDLDVVNWVNEGLINVSNATKGKAKMPRGVFFTNGLLADTEDAGVMCNLSGIRSIFNGTLLLRRDTYKNIDTNLLSAIDTLEKIGINDIYKETVKDTQQAEQSIIPYIVQNAQKMKDGSLSFNEKMKLYNNIKRFYDIAEMLVKHPLSFLQIYGVSKAEMEEFAKLPHGAQFDYMAKIANSSSENTQAYKLLDPFSYIYHEMGHLQDTVKRCPATGKFNSPDKYPKELKEWLANEDNMRIAYSVSPYAATGEAEFIADTFALRISGKKLSKSAERLYRELNGPAFDF